MLLTPAGAQPAFRSEKGFPFGTAPILALKAGRGQGRFADGEESAQALFMLFMTIPTIAETIAPETPPPTS